MIAEVRSLRAIPVLCTSVERRHFLGGGGNTAELEESLEDYPEVVGELAAELQVPLIDLNSWTRELYLRLGVERSRELFCHFEPGEHAYWPEGLADNTHFREEGARLIAGHVAGWLAHAGFGSNEGTSSSKSTSSNEGTSSSRRAPSDERTTAAFA